MAADFDNYKKRAAREKEEWIKFANEDLIKAILPFIDNLERAVNHAEKTEDFQGFSRRHEVDTSAASPRPSTNLGFLPLNRSGNPSIRPCIEAMLLVETDQHEPNQVVEEFQKGYLLNDRLLRPATVSVSKLPEKEAQATE